MEALKPCPFCGGKAKMIGGGLSQEAPTVWCINGHHLNAGADVWNTRADLDRWQPIETAPKDGTEVIVRCGPKDIRLGWYFAPSSRTKGWRDQMGKEINPTCWMPLPAPPEATQ